MAPWQIESAFRDGLAVLWSSATTGRWWHAGKPVKIGRWVDHTERRPKESFDLVSKMFRAAPYFPLPRYPKGVVVVGQLQW